MAKGDAGANFIWWGGAIFAGIIFIPKLLSAQTRQATPGQVATAQANKAIQAAGNVGTSWLSQALASLLKGNQQQQSKPSSGGGFGAAPTASGRALSAPTPTAMSPLTPGQQSEMIQASQQWGQYDMAAAAAAADVRQLADDTLNTVGPLFDELMNNTFDPNNLSGNTGTYIGQDGDLYGFAIDNYGNPYVQDYGAVNQVSEEGLGIIPSDGLIDESNPLPFYMWGDYGDYGYGDYGGYDLGGYGWGDDRYWDGSGWY